MEKIIASLKKKIEGCKLPDGIEVIPPYTSIKTSKEELYTRYSNLVMTYNKVCDTLAKLQFSVVTIDRLLRELPNSNEVFSKQKLYSTELRNLKEEAKGLVDSYKYLKDGFEAAVRFYNSVQYILSSFRMPEV